jgi:hypothetical protein
MEALSLISIPWLRKVLNRGQRFLHFYAGSDNTLIDELLRKCQEYSTITAAVLSFQACQHGYQESLVKLTGRSIAVSEVSPSKT